MLIFKIEKSQFFFVIKFDFVYQAKFYVPTCACILTFPCFYTIKSDILLEREIQNM